MMHCRSHWRPLLIAGLLVLSQTPAGHAADLSETALQVPVEVTNVTSTPVRRPVSVFVVRDLGRARGPYLVLLHGRPPDPARRLAMGMQTYPANARYFAEQGFVVLIPTRIGYGVTGGPDLEFTGDCDAKNFQAGVDPAVEETKAIVHYVATVPYVDPTRGLVVGESFGGLVAVAAAGAGIAGLQGVVNVAGGDGGDSVRHVDQPCQPERLAAQLERWGAVSHVPTLWMYSANDRFWGPRWPTVWFHAFEAAGGQGRYVPLPADKNNGHFIFTRNAPAWHPAFESFVNRLGFAVPAARPSGGATVSTP